MKIAIAASEVFPFAKTGGLGDVVGTLPTALQKLGHEVKVFIPLYSLIDHERYDLAYCWKVGEMPIRVNGKILNVNVFESFLPNTEVEIFFVNFPPFYHRGTIYTNDIDEDERFILFNKAVIESLQRLNWQPDIIHCNDWQTGLIPLYIKDNYNWDKFFDNTATVITIHNIGYQGRFPKETLYKAEIRESLFYQNSPIEVWGSVSFLKTGLIYADAVNTVSETYAGEITTSEYGAGLEGVLIYRVNDFYGILNGADYSIWNPENDRHIPFHYSINELNNKYENKKFLLNSVNLPYNPNVPLIGIISRFVSQKGLDLFSDVSSELMNLNVQWLILGSGESKFEEMFKSLAYNYPNKVYTYIGFNNELAHLIEAASDIFLMPSRYEPCGLNQIYSMKYGTVPIVRKTGGLADTVQDWDEMNYLGYNFGNGFSFNDQTGFALYSSIIRALRYFQNKNIWNKIIRNGMSRNYSWEVSAKKYVELYNKAISNRRG